MRQRTPHLCTLLYTLHPTRQTIRSLPAHQHLVCRLPIHPPSIPIAEMLKPARCRQQRRHLLQNHLHLHSLRRQRSLLYPLQQTKHQLLHQMHHQRRDMKVRETARKKQRPQKWLSRQESLSNAIKKYISSIACLLYTSPSPRDATLSRMPSSA